MAEKKAKSSSKPIRRWKFEFGAFGMIGLGMVGVLIMAWAFILGILVGRGYSPESVIPELGRIVTPQTPAISTAPPTSILRPEELRFHEALQKPGSQPISTAPGRSDPSQDVPQAPSQNQLQAQPAPPPPPASPPMPATAAPMSPRFEFVYQVGSFQNIAQARTLQQSMVDSGYLSSVEAGMVDGRQWYRVLVTIRGTQEEAEHVKTRLMSLGIATSFLRAKKSL